MQNIIQKSRFHYNQSKSDGSNNSYYNKSGKAFKVLNKQNNSQKCINEMFHLTETFYNSRE